MFYKNSSESTGRARAPKKPTPKVESARTKNQWLIQLAVNCAMSMVALVLLGMPLRANAQTLGGQLQPKPDNSSAVEITSANVPQDMILPRDQFSGIHFYQSGEFFSKFPDPKSTPSGLYLLDTEFVPKQLPEILAKDNVALGPDGTLVNQEGEKVVMLLKYRIAAVTKKPADGGVSAQQGTLPPSWPYPLEYVSAWYSWRYYNGFCRYGDAYTGGDAWGPIIDQYNDRAHTNIDYMEMNASLWAGGGPWVVDDEWRYNVSSDVAHAHKDIGCWWQAYGYAQFGWAYFYDAPSNFSWSWSW
jgi:hypothetical protein